MCKIHGCAPHIVYFSFQITVTESQNIARTEYTVSLSKVKGGRNLDKSTVFNWFVWECLIILDFVSGKLNASVYQEIYKVVLMVPKAV